MRIIVFFSLFLTLWACSQYDENVRKSFEVAGSNKKELKKVIEHYEKNPGDSLKLKAAYFLISNMSDQYSLEGDLLNKYLKCLKNPKKSTLDSISRIHGSFDLTKLDVKFDIQHLNSAFLINNIDNAFKVWKEQPWGNKIMFQDFCECILPYRVKDEMIEYDRVRLYEQYIGLLDSAKTIMDACFAINKNLKKDGWNGTYDISFLPHFSFKTLREYRTGTCRDRVDYTIHTMRALGIPVSNDFTPQWANRSMGHNWNTLLDEKGKRHQFIGTDYSPGEKNYQAVGTKPPKVYRRTFSVQKESLAVIKDDKDEVPSLFHDSHFKDVTDEYHSCSDITIQLKGEYPLHHKFAYICVFDNRNWIPVHWGKILNDKVIFTKMSNDGIVYLPVYYKNKQLIPASDPFLLTENGKIKYLKPNMSEKQRIKLTRKYPVFMDQMYLKRMFRGKFQASTDSFFKEAYDIHVIKDSIFEMKWYEVPVNISKKSRFFRYLAPDKSYGNIAEIEFYFHGKKLNGKTIGTPGSFLNKPEKRFASATDGDRLTFFEYKVANGAWVGIDFEKPVSIDKIRYLPRNDGNMIVEGNKYELCFWNNNQWISIGNQIATDTKLIFENVPLNSLLFLHNLTEGKEERIFTYENDKQIWW